MKILIFEGIATSGKTTVIDGLIKSLPRSLKTAVLTEEQTHIPIMKKTDESCKDFFQELISRATSTDNDLIIFDRLYLTQAFRAKVSLDEYADIERLLAPYSPLSVLLRVDESAIADRITKAKIHREPTWGDYVSTKGGTTEEQAAYYINQQRHQLELLKQSTLPYTIFDATTHSYDSIIEELKKNL